MSMLIRMCMVASLEHDSFVWNPLSHKRVGVTSLYQELVLKQSYSRPSVRIFIKGGNGDDGRIKRA